MTAARGGGMNSLGVDTQEVAGRGGPTPYNSSGTRFEGGRTVARPGMVRRPR